MPSTDREFLNLLERGVLKREATALMGWNYEAFRYRQRHDEDFARKVAAAYDRGQAKIARERTKEAQAHADAVLTLQAKVDSALEGLVNYREAARMLGVSSEGVRMMVRSGRIVKVKTPAGPLVAIPNGEAE